MSRAAEQECQDATKSIDDSSQNNNLNDPADNENDDPSTDKPEADSEFIRATTSKKDLEIFDAD